MNLLRLHKFQIPYMNNDEIYKLKDLEQLNTGNSQQCHPVSLVVLSSIHGPETIRKWIFMSLCLDKT